MILAINLEMIMSSVSNICIYISAESLFMWNSVEQMLAFNMQITKSHTFFLSAVVFTT